MAVVFEFEVGKGFHFADAFAKRFNVPVKDERICLPADMGDGFIQEVFLDNGLALCVHNYTLKQDFVLKRLATGPTSMLTMKFDCRKVPIKFNEGLQNSLFAESKGCEVEFGTSNFFSELTVPANQAIVFLVIAASRQTLTGLLKLNPNEHPITNMLNNNTSFVMHEGMTQEMERALKQLSQVNQSTKLPGLFYQTKACELIYNFFTKLLTRTNTTPVTINPPDAEKIYAVRAEILKDLSKTPQLPELAARIGISLTKMKQLFNQIFGKSIYNYYQAERMNAAAELLSILSVSETGYRVGFTNLSHFTRLFEKYHQMKPKRYKNTLEAG
jgi:AraC-like DNA-binding protein